MKKKHNTGVTPADIFKKYNIPFTSVHALEGAMLSIMQAYLAGCTGDPESLLYGELGGWPFILGLGDAVEEVTDFVEFQQNIQANFEDIIDPIQKRR